VTRQRIAVTGANGAIGRRLVALLEAKGIEVVALQRDITSRHSAATVVRPFDLSDPASVMAEQLSDVSQLVHLAATMPGRTSGQDADASLWTINVLGTQRLIEAMNIANVKRIVLAGAANVYRADQSEAREDSPMGPASRVLYLASKASQEWLVASLCREHEIDYTILRISSVIGDGRSIVDKLAQRLASGQSVQIQDGAAFGADFIDCRDVCNGLILAIELQLNGVYNLSTGYRTELIDMVIKFAEILHKPSNAIEILHANRAPDAGFPAVNSDRLKSLGFTPTPLPEVLERIAYAGSNRDTGQ